MARRNPTTTVGYGDENAKPFNLRPKLTAKTDEHCVQAAQAGARRRALGCIQANKVVENKQLPKRDCAKQQPTAIRRSARLGASNTDNSRPSGRFEIFDDSSCDASEKPPIVGPVEAAAAKEPLCLALPVGATAAPVSPDSRMECEWSGESPMILDTSLHTLEPMCYSDVREQESNDEYARDVYNYLRQQEVKMLPTPNYMQKQPDITPTMRTILVDWLVEVAEEYKLHEETLFLAVSYVDRFLSSMSVQRTKLQLVGTASLLIAAKFEEIYPPEVCEFVYITDDTYTKKQVLRMEQVVLKVLSFDIAAPTIYYFLQRFAEVNKCPEKVTFLAQYLCELSLLDDEPYLQYIPSVIAGAAISLSNHTLGRHPWGRDLVDYSGYEVSTFRECIHSLYSSFCNASSRAQQAVHDKFKSPKFHCVAELKPSPTLPF
uniref:Putative g2/mitotic-specific cyclin a n=1 Tax=Amblyomma triste TaxID=251400 RepID=A0A023GK10_AMBTT